MLRIHRDEDAPKEKEKQKDGFHWRGSVTGIRYAAGLTGQRPGGDINDVSNLPARAYFSKRNCQYFTGKNNFLMRYSDKFGRYLRAVRESKGYSQEYVAERLGIGQSSYACLEAGRTGLTIERLVQLTGILEIDVHMLIDDVLPFPEKEKKGTGNPADRATDQLALIESLQSEIRFLRALVLRQGHLPAVPPGQSEITPDLYSASAKGK